MASTGGRRGSALCRRRPAAGSTPIPFAIRRIGGDRPGSASSSSKVFGVCTLWKIWHCSISERTPGCPLRRPGVRAPLQDPSYADACGQRPPTAGRRFGLAIAQLWEAGIDVDWSGYRTGVRGRQMSLPSSPFDRRRCWIGREAHSGCAFQLAAAPACARLGTRAARARTCRWLARGRARDGDRALRSLAAAICSRWRGAGRDGGDIIMVVSRGEYRRVSADEFAIRPNEGADYRP